MGLQTPSKIRTVGLDKSGYLRNKKNINNFLIEKKQQHFTKSSNMRTLLQKSGCNINPGC